MPLQKSSNSLFIFLRGVSAATQKGTVIMIIIVKQNTKEERIQDLINWIYHTEITVPTHEYIKNNTDSEPQISKLVLNKLFADKAFYTQALAMSGQNNLYDYMLEETKTNWMCLCHRILCDLQLAEQTVTEKMHIALESAMTYYCYGHFFATQQWVKNDMNIAPDIFAHMLDTAATKGLYSMLIEAIR